MVDSMSDCRECIHLNLNYSESEEGKYYTIHMSCKVFNSTKPMMTSLDCPRFERILKGDYTNRYKLYTNPDDIPTKAYTTQIEFKVTKENINHRLDPVYYLYNEYVGLPKQKKKILNNSDTTLEEKLKEYNKLKQRERKLRNILIKESLIH